jgi:endo-1,4-beta-xylanase
MDDTIQTGETDNWQDDSVEIYIDANHARTETYEDDDAQITIGAANIITGSSGAADIGVNSAVVETDDGWIVECAIPLNTDKFDLAPAAGMVIGFNVHLNDDDDGGGRDHKLIWSDLDVDDASWNNPTRFADLTFVAADTSAVEPSDKLAITWGSVKE